MEEGRRAKQKDLAKRLEVSERTLRNWKRFALKNSFPKVGRPKLTNVRKEKLKFVIKIEWIRQGKPGWRCVKASLPTVPTRLIQEIIRELKAKDRSEEYELKRVSSRRVNVLYKNIIWSQDTTFNQSRSNKLEVIKDRGSLKYLSVDQIKKINSKSVSKVISKCAKKRKLPLVIMTDNGSGYKSKDFKSYLEKNCVIHLKSLARCPQHNGAVERCIRELKSVLSFNGNNINSALITLNENRRYASKSYRTSSEIESDDTIEISSERRKLIYERYQKKMLRLEKEEPSVRKRKLKERKFVFDMLEEEGLIKQSIGSLKL